MKIVVVDDEPISRMVLQGIVESLGHECLPAGDVEQGWRLVADADPDVVVSDRLMPGGDGLELCRRIRSREDGRYVYVIVATSLNRHADVMAGMRAGADDYLAKPVDPLDLQARLVGAERVGLLHVQLAAYRSELARLAGTDPLTQLRNRLALGTDLAEVHARAQRYARDYCVVMCDVDNFKAYNDAHGHQAGDEVLRRVSDALSREARQGDLVYRYGGEEFLLVLPEQTASSAAAAAERTRRAVEQLGIPHADRSERAVVTISAGVAAFRSGDDLTAEDVLRRADAALYGAKTAGRNRVEQASPCPAVPSSIGLR